MFAPRALLRHLKTENSIDTDDPGTRKNDVDIGKCDTNNPRIYTVDTQIIPLGHTEFPRIKPPNHQVVVVIDTDTKIDMGSLEDRRHP